MRFLIFLVVICLYMLDAHAGLHTVQKGETFASIAKLYKITTDSLIKANPNTNAYTGLTIDVPVSTLVYDLGESDLFRKMRYGYSANIKKGIKCYNSGLKKQLSNIKDGNPRTIEQISNSYMEAISYGNVDALYQLGRRYVRGYYIPNDNDPDFSLCDVNADIHELKQGIEYLQIAGLLGNTKALVELALICGYEKSPIRNPYLCLEMLETYKKELGLPVNGLLCHMYENGYGISKDYLQAYINCPTTTLVGNDSQKETHREKLLKKIESLPTNFESSKYGVGLDSAMLMSIALLHYKNKKMDPEGIFWLHRAARLNNADANWALACLLQNDQCEKNSMGNSWEKESQMIYFANKSAKLGKKEASDFVKVYEKNKEIEEKNRLNRLIEEQRRKEERRRQNTQKWLNFAGAVLQATAQTYVMAEAAKHQNAYNATSSMSNMRIGQMSDAQWAAKNQLALQQIMQYTENKSYADWTGTPMVPTDMSAVDLGPDTGPGSALHMWNLQQRINTITTQNTKMRCEQLAFYRRQADMVYQHIMEHPNMPIDGCIVDYNGNWIAGNMGASDMAASSNSNLPNSGNDWKTKQKEMYDRYGDKQCDACKGSGKCPTCNGTKVTNNPFGLGNHKCPNCYLLNGNRTGLCSTCQGKGTVYGLK